MDKKNVVMVLGTRPEATKMGPVYHSLRVQDRLCPLVLLTGQHKEQLHQALDLFDIPVDVDLDVMKDRQTTAGVASRIIPAVAEQLEALKTDYLLVHGDTLTTFAAAWTGFLEEVPVGHVEAGLRSHDLQEPYPEEANRRLTDVITDLDFAPTPSARENLIDEGKEEDQIIVTGQTGVDAIIYAEQKGTGPELCSQGNIVTVTMHRRENWPVLEQLAETLADVARSHREFTFVYPVHLNPVVQESVRPVLEDVSNFVLMDPLEYGEMAALLAQSCLIITDSGGLQEEGAALGVPVVVLRNVTERPEGVETGALRMAGTEPTTVRSTVEELLKDPEQRRRMAESENPYGDGRASERVAQGVAWRLGVARQPADWS